MNPLDEGDALQAASMAGALRPAAFACLVLGGLNAGLTGLIELDMVALLLGVDTAPACLAYVLMGIAAVMVSFPDPLGPNGTQGRRPERARAAGDVL